MFRLENPASDTFQKFLAAQGPFGLRFAGALAEGGASADFWVDDPAAPRLALQAGRGWLAPVGEAEAVLARLEELERISAQMEESEGYLKLSSVTAEVKNAVARRRNLVRAALVGMFVLEEEDFRPPASEHRVESLQEAEAETLARNSPYHEGTAYGLARIRSAPTAAIRVGGALASYVVVHANGSIGMLHTEERFRGRGLARAVVSSLVEKQFARGRAAYCYIVEGNAASERVFESLGFKRVADVFWSVFDRREAYAGTEDKAMRARRDEPGASPHG